MCRERRNKAHFNFIKKKFTISPKNLTNLENTEFLVAEKAVFRVLCPKIKDGFIDIFDAG